jgi:hypothetical protein
LHPALYCYDFKGKFIGKAMIGAIQFVRELSANNKFFEFTDHRRAFEDFLVDHPHVMAQIGATQGSGGRRGVPAVIALYNTLFECVSNGLDAGQTVSKMKSVKALDFIDWSPSVEIDAGERFEKADTNAAVMRTTLEKDICPICKGRFYIKDRSRDHISRKQDGGKSVLSNFQLTHPYCNTGYKERLAHLGGKNEG